MKKYIQWLIDRIRNSDIANRMATGAFWSLTGTAFAKGIVLISSIVCAHILVKAEYGEFGMVRSTINMFVVFGAAGLGATATKYISEYREYQKDRVGSIYKLTSNFAFLTGAIVSLSVLLLADYLAANTLNAPYLAPSIKVGALLLFVTVINGAQQGTLSGFENFKAIAINTLIGSITESVFMLVGAYLYGVFGAILGFGTGFVALYITNRYAIIKTLNENEIKFNAIHVDRKDWTLLYKFSLPAALSSMLVGPAYWVARTLLVRNSGFEELAIFEAAEQWRVIILFIPSAVSSIVLPILSSLSTDDTNRFWKVLKFNLLGNATIAAIIALIVCLFSGFIMNLYGEHFNDKLPLILSAVSTVFSTMASVVGSSIYSRAKVWNGFCFNILWSIMFVGGTYVFVIKGFGASGLSLALLLSYLVHTFLQLIYLKYIVRGSVSNKWSH